MHQRTGEGCIRGQVSDASNNRLWHALRVSVVTGLFVLQYYLWLELMMNHYGCHRWQIRSRADRKSYGSFGPISRALPSLVAQHRPANLSFAQPLFPVQLLSYRIAALSASLSPLLLPFSHHSLSRSSPDRQPLAHSRTALSLLFVSRPFADNCL